MRNNRKSLNENQESKSSGRQDGRHRSSVPGQQSAGSGFRSSVSRQENLLPRAKRSSSETLLKLRQGRDAPRAQRSTAAALSTQHSAPPPPPSPLPVESLRVEREGEGRGGGASALSLRIADITLSIHTTDASLKLQLQGATKSFCTRGGNPDITIEIGRDDLSGIETGDKKIFDSGSTWRLYETNGNYKFYFYSEAIGPVPYKTAEVQKNFSRATVFIHNPYFDPSRPIYPLEYPLDELLFVHFLSQGRGVEVHACGVSDSDGKGYLFLGQSGAGKSTMAGLWKDQTGINILSDDRIVLRKINGGFWMYGTPWHGEGRFFSASRARLSRIYFLEKRKKNEAIPYRAAEAIGRLTACSFLPFYNSAALDFAMAFFEEMVKTVPTGELRFVPDRNVIEMIRGAGARLP